MSKRLLLRNLSYRVTEEDLLRAFAAWGPRQVTLSLGSQGRPTGVGFVDIADDAQARLAIAAMNGTKLDGLDITVREARSHRVVLGCSRRAAAAMRR